MNQKNIFLTLASLLMLVVTTQAHYLWIETAPTGKIGKEQEVRVYFGEYTYGLQEEVRGEGFEKVKKFKVWVIAPNGEKTELAFEPKEKYYSASFTPESAGTYTIALNNDEIEVIDYTQYDFGIFKTHYHSVAKVVVKGGLRNTAANNPEGLTIVDHSKNAIEKGAEQTLQVLYKGEPLAEAEVIVFVADLWSKELETDEQGKVTFKLPWETKYIIEVSKKEEVPGNYNGQDYEFIYHAVTYSIQL